MRTRSIRAAVVVSLIVCFSIPACRSPRQQDRSAAAPPMSPDSGSTDRLNKQTDMRPAVYNVAPAAVETAWRCRADMPYMTPERLERSYTIVLPGVDGASLLNANLSRGLAEGGCNGAIELIDWTTGVWPLFPYHLVAHKRNRKMAGWIAELIVEYQDRFPGRPVNLVGHSAGGAMAVMILEALPAGHTADRVVLLATALSPRYDLSVALERTEAGLWNFHTVLDAVALIGGTLVLGTADRRHSVSAGAVGFYKPRGLSADQRRLYDRKLHQQPYELRMIKSGNLGGHFHSVQRKFAADWVAPIILGTRDREPQTTR